MESLSELILDSLFNQKWQLLSLMVEFDWNSF